MVRASVKVPPKTTHWPAFTHTAGPGSGRRKRSPELIFTQQLWNIAPLKRSSRGAPRPLTI